MRMTRLVVLGLVLTALACGGDDDDTAATTTTADETTTTAASGAPTAGEAVQIANFAFDPKDLTVATGATVRWTNTDDTEHSVESTSDLAFESERLAQDASFEQTFDTAGEYSYVCGIHNFMTGTITVAG